MTLFKESKALTCPTVALSLDLQLGELKNHPSPSFMGELRKCPKEFEQRYPGFAGDEAFFIGTETRTSSPVSIPRGANAATPKFNNLYPCGEGAGYAGGIVSAALDGLYVANTIRQNNS